MFKIAAADTPGTLKEADAVMRRIYQEDPRHWPYGLSSRHFDGGVYLIREKRSNTVAGFAGWQERHEVEFDDQHQKKSSRFSIFGTNPRAVKVGYYSIGVLPEFRRNGFAKEAIAKLIAFKSASVDRVKALIVEGNDPSMALARSLQVPVLVKSASLDCFKGLLGGLFHLRIKL